MKKTLLPAVLITLVIASCQKEIDWSTGTGGTVTSEKLVRIKSKTGTDTTQIDYTYDASNRLIREKTTGTGSGVDLDNDLIIKRNSSGIITSTVQKAAALVLAGIDSVETRFNYSTGTSRYTSAIFTLTVAGFGVTDSAVYSYDANGRISSDAHYLAATGLPIPLPPVLALRNTYSYSSSGANLVSIQQEATTAPGGPLSPVSTQTFTFDSKTNPLIILTEAIITARTGLYNANNATKAVLANTIDPSQDFTMDYTYKYNSSNKPDSSYGTRTPGGAVTATKYFYQ